MLKPSHQGESVSGMPMPLLHFLPAYTLPAAPAGAAGAAAATPSSQGAASEQVQKQLSECCVYECPLYKTSARQGVFSSSGQASNLVLCVKLPAAGLSRLWVLQGTCLLCHTSE